MSQSSSRSNAKRGTGTKMDRHERKGKEIKLDPERPRFHSPDEPEWPFKVLSLENGFTYRLTFSIDNKNVEDDDGKLKIHALFPSRDDKLQHNELNIAEVNTWDFIHDMDMYWSSINPTFSPAFWKKEYDKHGRRILPPKEYFSTALQLRGRVENSLNLENNKVRRISDFYNMVKARLGGLDFELRLNQIRKVSNVRFTGKDMFRKDKRAANVYLLWSIGIRIDPKGDEFEYGDWGEKRIYDKNGRNPISTDDLGKDMIVPRGSVKMVGY